jgi:hypothetical protein
MTKKHAPQYFICSLNFKSQNFQTESHFKCVAFTYRGSTTLGFLVLQLRLTLRTVMQMESTYMADHEGKTFPIPKSLGLWDNKIAKDATVVEMKKAKSIHKACSKDYKIWKTAQDGCKKLFRAAVEEVYINKLKDGTTFFHYLVFVLDLLEHFKKNSTGHHALDIVVMLCLNMLLLYKNAASMLSIASHIS